MSKCMEGIWRVQKTTQLLEEYNLTQDPELWKHIEALYTYQCPRCGVDVIRFTNDYPETCSKCHRTLRRQFAKREEVRQYKIKCRILKKEISDISRLLTTARKLINEVNE